MGLFSSSKKKADLPPEKKHCATIVDLATTDAEQGLEWKFEKSRYDADSDQQYCNHYTLTLDDGKPSRTYVSGENAAMLALSSAMNQNIFNIGRILKNLTDKVDRVLAQNKELQERCEALENKAEIQRR